MFYTRRILSAIFCLSVSAVFADCTTSAPNGHTVDGASLWPDMPTQSPQTATDCNIDQFAWNNFLYLAGDDGGGHPRFMALAPWYDAMPASGKPAAPNKYTPLQAGQMLDQLNKGQAGDGFHLLDVAGKTVTYDIRVNDAIVDYVAQSGMYSKGAISRAAAEFKADPLKGGIWLPPNGKDSASALEIKTAWRNYGSNGGDCPADIMHCEQDSGGTWWGLVGMHFVQKTPSHGEMIWASFEHVANAPDCGTGGSYPVAKNPGQLNANKNIPALADKTGWSLFNYSTYGGDGKTCAYPQAGGGGNPQCLTNPNPSGDKKTWVPVNVCRTDQLPPAGGCASATDNLQIASCLNNSVQGSLSGKWKNYELVGAEYVHWGVSGAGAPLVGCWNFKDGTNSLSCITHPPYAENIVNYNSVARVGTLDLANATMETWMQKNISLATAGGTWTQQDCLSCHQPTTAIYQGDMSHLFDRAQQFGDVDAGPIWNQADAQHKCPAVCQGVGGKWNGQWTTTVPGQMSVCGCVQDK